ncbi:hypothetical protein BY458DRAFT_33562 [Sporodiniella umbellata]|nr:hypothetical protein BY458DRAFT_33562 [Sporodiniella umbellata]
MRAIGELYDLGRGKKRMQIRTNTTETGRSSSAVQSPTALSPTVQSPTHIAPSSPIRSPKPKEPSRHQSLPPPKKDPKPTTKPRSQSNGDRSQFNFEKTKPKIMQEVAIANQNSNNLLNALRLINTSEDRWEIDLQYDARLQEYRNRCEDSRKKIVRYVRLVEDEEWIGTLLKANEDLLKGLDMYDIMLTGEVPVVWQPKESNKMIRAPPPPPPPMRTSPPLQIELGNLRINDTQHEELDPFADPTTPVEETHAY